MGIIQLKNKLNTDEIELLQCVVFIEASRDGEWGEMLI